MQRKRLIFLLVILLFLFTSVALTGGSGFDLSWHLFSGGGGHVQGGNYALDSSIGQPLVGVAGAEGTTLCAGFWCTQPPVPSLPQHFYLPAVTHTAP